MPLAAVPLAGWPHGSSAGASITPASFSAKRTTITVIARTHASAASAVYRSAEIRLKKASTPAKQTATSVQSRRSRSRPPPPKARTASGSVSPTTIRYDVATPKHLIAIAASSSTPSPGSAASATE